VHVNVVHVLPMYTSLNIMGRMATTKTATARLPLTTQSTISLFIGLLSSAYISFLAGQLLTATEMLDCNFPPV